MRKSTPSERREWRRLAKAECGNCSACMRGQACASPDPVFVLLNDIESLESRLETARKDKYRLISLLERKLNEYTRGAGPSSDEIHALIEDVK